MIYVWVNVMRLVLFVLISVFVVFGEMLLLMISVLWNDWCVCLMMCGRLGLLF